MVYLEWALFERSPTKYGFVKLSCEGCMTEVYVVLVFERDRLYRYCIDCQLGSDFHPNVEFKVHTFRERHDLVDIIDQIQVISAARQIYMRYNFEASENLSMTRYNMVAKLATDLEFERRQTEIKPRVIISAVLELFLDNKAGIQQIRPDASFQICSKHKVTLFDHRGQCLQCRKASTYYRFRQRVVAQLQSLESDLSVS